MPGPSKIKLSDLLARCESHLAASCVIREYIRVLELAASRQEDLARAVLQEKLGVEQGDDQWAIVCATFEPNGHEPHELFEIEGLADEIAPPWEGMAADEQDDDDDEARAAVEPVTEEMDPRVSQRPLRAGAVLAPRAAYRNKGKIEGLYTFKDTKGRSPDEIIKIRDAAREAVQSRDDRKLNEFENHRGKNAWKRQLYRTVFVGEWVKAYGSDPTPELQLVPDEPHTATDPGPEMTLGATPPANAPKHAQDLTEQAREPSTPDHQPVRRPPPPVPVIADFDDVELPPEMMVEPEPPPPPRYAHDLHGWQDPFADVVEKPSGAISPAAAQFSPTSRPPRLPVRPGAPAVRPNLGMPLRPSAAPAPDD